MDPEEILEIGKIVGVHGIRGQIKVYCHTDSLEPLQPGKTLLLKTPEGSCTPYTVKQVQPYKNILRVALDGLDDRDSAEGVVGMRLCIHRSALPETEAGTWYWCDLIGLDVYCEEEGFIGRVASMIETGSNDVFVVRRGDREILIPAIDSVVIEIDTAAHYMRVALPEGL